METLSDRHPDERGEAEIEPLGVIGEIYQIKLLYRLSKKDCVNIVRYADFRYVKHDIRA